MTTFAQVTIGALIGIVLALGCIGLLNIGAKAVGASLGCSL